MRDTNDTSQITRVRSDEKGSRDVANSREWRTMCRFRVQKGNSR